MAQPSFFIFKILFFIFFKQAVRTVSSQIRRERTEHPRSPKGKKGPCALCSSQFWVGVGEIQLLKVGLNQDLALQYYLQNKLPHVLLVLTTYCISLRGFNDYHFWDSWQKSSAERTYWKTSCEMSPLWFLFYEEWIRPSTSYLGSWR